MGDNPWLSGSPFRAHLGTNYAPSDLEVAQIRDYVSQPLQRLQEVEALVEALLVEKGRLVGALKSHNALNHPIRRVPQEILQLIFIQCLPSGHHQTMDKTDAPIVLTRVCRSWRALALETRRLWSSIHIVTPSVEEFGEREASFHAARVLRWLALAGDAALSISVFSEWRFQPEASDIHVQGALSLHSYHIRELKLKVSEPYLEEIIGNPVQWPILEKLVIDLKPEDHNLAIGRWMTAFWENGPFRAPNLRSIELNHFDPAENILHLNWAHVEEFRVRGLTGNAFAHDPTKRISFPREDVRRMLQVATKMRSLHISVDDRFQGGFLDVSQYDFRIPIDAEIVLEELTTLNLADRSLGREGESLLENICLPSLTDLSYDLTNIDGRIPLPRAGTHPVLRFLYHQSTPVLITRFSINSKAIDEDALIGCLGFMRALERLWVYHAFSLPGGWVEGSGAIKSPPLEPRILHSMYVSGDESFCPRLSDVRLDCIDTTENVIRAFYEGRLTLATFRPESFTNIRRLRVGLVTHAPVFVPRYPGCIDEELGRLAQCGLEEDLKDAGVDATIEFKRRTTCWRTPQDAESTPYDPRAGLVDEAFAEWL